MLRPIVAAVLAPLLAPAAAQVEFLEAHVVGISLNPAVVSIGWRVTADSGDARDFSLRIKDRTNGGGWVDHAVVVDERTDDDWYLWTGTGASAKGADDPAFPFACGTEYFVQVVTAAGAKTAKLAVKMPSSASCGRDDFREIWGGKPRRNRHRRAW